MGGGYSWTLVYDDIISVENLLEAWREFKRDKRKRADVQEFGRNLMSNVLDLHRELATGTYQHGGYHHFKISDPKPRDIHKASARDRLVHHSLHRKLYPFFDRIFIADSYSCRIEKGTHKAMNRFRAFAYKVSQNNTRTCWVLKCDIRKFFASIDHEALVRILRAHISDERLMLLLVNIIGSFNSDTVGRGLPLGNLTSQLLVNIYMNEFDQFVKHKIKAKYYIRYADDFVIFSHDRTHLVEILPYMDVFLRYQLKLKMHPNKVSIATLSSGVDFLGWVHFPDRRVLRTSTKKRMFRNIQEKQGHEATVQSYLGLLSHGNAWKLQESVKSLHEVALAKHSV
ncbi:hypothetical protein A3G63_02535 [Candidatus Kaiserbacteria bacterium RIFCSPLOWO2_12_FULL_52_8]|nr:MAG: hypothetical protein A3G63_02535 [Candidatus Kaiserbacteria bacterium RIFCSPLOWO2_12_FULL_52_8]